MGVVDGTKMDGTGLRADSLSAATYLRVLGRLGLYVAALVLAVGMLFPFYWMISASLQTYEELNTFPPKWFPSSFHWINYVRAWIVGNFSVYTTNSIIVAIAHLALQVSTCSLAGYAFARLRFPGRRVLFLVLLATSMVPWPVTIIPSFLIIKHIPLAGGNSITGVGGTGLLNTLWALILPGAVNVIGVFFLRQYFLNLPPDLEDAARVDGCSEFGVLWRVILPISLPGIATFSLLAFEDSWNSFIWPLVMLSRPAVYTLPLGLRNFIESSSGGDAFTDYGPLMAASVMVILPIIIIFLLAQRVFVQGIALTGTKG